MAKFQIFVCVNRRPPNHREGCCEARGGKDLLTTLEAEAVELGLAEIVEIKPTGCLDRCPDGPVLVIYEDQNLSAVPHKLKRLFVRGTPYGRLTPFDVPELLRRHVIERQVLERCRI